MPSILIYPLAGALAGLLAGLLGVGGGVVVVPALVWAFGQMGVSQRVLMHLAIGTSLASIVVTASAAATAHHRRGGVRWQVLRGLAPGLMLGAALGGRLAQHIPTTGLRLIFGGFLLLVAIRMQWNRQPNPSRNVPRALALSLTGALIGGFSAMVGIGGGTLTVPFLVWCNVPLRQAVGTSAAAAVPIALLGAASFAWSGWGIAELPPGSTGYVHWPSLVGLTPLALLCAPLGTRLAHRLPTSLVRRAFGVLLLLVAARMIFSAR